MKYKLKFKAQDELNDGSLRLKKMKENTDKRREKLPPIIRDFLKNYGYSPSSNSGDIYPYVHEDGVTVIAVDLFADAIFKTKKTGRGGFNYILFTNEELRFFNGLGFKTGRAFRDYTKQTITDWWER